MGLVIIFCYTITWKHILTQWGICLRWYTFMLFLVASAILNVASMVTMALPRLPQFGIRFIAHEVEWYRWEARVCFLVNVLTFSGIMIMRDFGFLWLHNCSRFTLDAYSVISVCVIIIGIGLLHLFILELYLRWFPKLLIM